MKYLFIQAYTIGNYNESYIEYVIMKLTEENIKIMEDFIKVSMPKEGLPKPDTVSFIPPGKFCIFGVEFMETPGDYQHDKMFVMDDEIPEENEIIKEAEKLAMEEFDLNSVRFTVQEEHYKMGLFIEGYIDTETNDRFGTGRIEMDEIYDCFRKDRACNASDN